MLSALFPKDLRACAPAIHHKKFLGERGYFKSDGEESG